MKGLYGFIIAIALISGFKLSVENGFLSFFGAAETFMTLIVVIMVGIYVLYNEEHITAEQLWGLYFILFLLLTLPSFASFMNSERGEAFVAEQAAEAEVTAKNMNLKESFLAWITHQEQTGAGELIGNAETENTYEYIGVKIEGIEPWKEEFYSTEPVYVDIDYSANSYFPITVITGCEIDGIGSGKVDKPMMQVSNAQANRVRCTFENLPKGHHVVDVVAVYSYESTVRIPMKYMEEEFANTLLLLSKDSGNSITAESYVGGSQKPITSAGPIAIGVSNTKKDGVSVLQMPIEIDSNNMNKNPTRLKLQLQENELGGEISRVENASFNLPIGMTLQGCDFLKNNQDLENSYEEENGRWTYNLNSQDGFASWNDLTTISCQFGFQEDSFFSTSAKDYFLPPQLKWSPQTILFSMQYQFKIEQSASIEVVA